MVGNLGLNTNYRASVREPLVRYAGSLNTDTKTDAILTQYFPDEEGQRRAFPVASYDALTRQIIELRKKFPFYLNYATATVDDILTEEQRERSTVDSITTLESIYLENRGDHFEVHPLPTLAQVGPAQHLLPGHFDGDEHLDLLLVGSNRGTSATEAWYSAQMGLLLRGNGKGQFEAVSSAASGFWAPQGNALGVIQIDNEPHLLVAQRSDSLKIYSYPNRQPL